MKKLHLLLLSVTLCVFSACHNDIWDAIDGLDSRVTKLEELCKEMNTNITSLQTIVDVLQANDYITGIVEIKKDGKVIGYTITFGKHDPITIYHGQDGKDGADGKDGQDGQNGSANAPVLGVAQDTDGVYYWTLNGEWLLDDNGNKLPVSGKDGQNGINGSNGQDGADGKDGQDGEDGKDGTDGQDGKDGITPQLKIEDGYWYISYDNGATWTQLGKANGEDGKDGADGKDGQNGADGKDGQDGDSIFESVTEDDDYVYFTLSNGTVIKLPKGSGNQSSMGDGYVTSGKADGYYYVDLDLPSGTKWATCNVGSNLVAGPGYFFAWGETVRKSIYDETSYTLNISDIPTDIHLTEYDAATVNWGNNWATPTKEHWNELLRWANWTYTTYNEINGWKVSGPNGNSIFLPAVGYSQGAKGFLYYLSSTFYGGWVYANGEYYNNCVYCITNDNYEYTNTPAKDPTQLPELQYVIRFHSAAGNPNSSGYDYYCLMNYYGYPIRPILVENE